MKRQSPSQSYFDKVNFIREREKERGLKRLWFIQQKKEREHEQLKQKRIKEYEQKRMEILKQESVKRREHSLRNYSRATSSSTAQVMFEELNSSEGNKPFFKEPIETMKSKEEELREITVKIVRNIPRPATETSGIQRRILDPESITLKRRDGEGAKPIFDRQELKDIKANEIEEYIIISKTSPALRSPAK